MSRIAECPQCQQRYSVSDDLLGRQIRCKACGAAFEIGAPTAAFVKKPPLAEPVADPPRPRSSPTPGRALPAGVSASSRAPVIQTADDEDQPPRQWLASMRVPGGRKFWIGLAIAAVALRLISRQATAPDAAPQAPVASQADSERPAPRLTPQELAALPQLPTMPYALDSATLLTRAADGFVHALFPRSFDFQPLGPEVVVADVACEVSPDQAGHNSRLRVYKPAGDHAAKSLGCVLVGVPGGTLIAASHSSIEADDRERLPYVQAGFVVVAFSQDGPLADNASQDEVQAASKKFFAAQAGLINARHALEFALVRLEAVDPARIYVAGRGSAGTLAMLFAEHEHRVRGCLAYAPVIDVRQRYLQIASEAKVPLSDHELALLQRTSPSTHGKKMVCPLLLFHGEHDPVVPVQESRQFAQQLRQLGKRVDLVTTATPGQDHHREIFEDGLRSGIEWLEDLEHPESVAQRKKIRKEAADRLAADRTLAPKTAAAERAPADPRPADADLKSEPKPVADSDAPQIGPQAPGHPLRQEALRAISRHSPKDAVRLLRGAILMENDRSLLEAVQWSPALKRPAAVLLWGFGAELNGFPSTGPTNVRPQTNPGERDAATEWKLSEQLKSLTGEIGVWLAQGLHNRVSSEGFGNWGESSRGASDHPGIALLDFAPVDDLITVSRAQHADVLMALSLTLNRYENGRPNTTLVVQLHDVQTGEKLWESKPLSNAKILSGRRQGKDPATELASSVLQFIDDEIVLRSVPKLSPAAVQQRLVAIAAESKIDPLTALIELRYLELAKHITSQEARTRLVEIVGPDQVGRLVSDDASERRAAIDAFLPESR